MNQHNEHSFNAGEVAPNPFSAVGSAEQNAGAIPTIPGFDMGAASKKPRINLHGLLTLAILGVAGVSIWGMRSIGLRGQTAIANQVSSELSIDTNKRAVMTVEDQKLLRDLNASRTDHQVPGEELQKNPFALSDAARPKNRPGSGQPLPPTASDEEVRAARQQELIGALGDFKLQGVMGGTNALARINGKAYRVGDTLGDKASNDKMNPVGRQPSAAKFVISAIEGREVTVTAEGFTFILSMDAQ